MSLLSELTTIITGEGLGCQTSVWTDNPAPSQYCVLTPITDTFHFSDNKPDNEIQYVRVEFFSKTAYTTKARALTKAFLDEGLTITSRQYVDHEDDTGYHHYAIEVAKPYEYTEENN